MKKGVLIVTAVAATLLLVGVTSARAVDRELPAQAQAAQEKVKEIKTKAGEVKCTLIQKRVTKRLTNFDVQKANHLVSYQKIELILAKKIAHMEDKGYNVTKLQENLDKYRELVANFEKDYQAYREQLELVRGATCDSDEVNFRSELAKARTMLKAVHNDAVAIRTFWAKTMRVDFLALKDQTPSTDTETDSDQSDSQDNTNTDTDSSDSTDTTNPDTPTDNTQEEAN